MSQQTTVGAEMNETSADKFTATPVQTTPSHVTLRVFVNGASAGLLTLRIKESLTFVDRISVGNPSESSADHV